MGTSKVREEMRALVDAATVGPWEAHHDEMHREWVIKCASTELPVRIAGSWLALIDRMTGDAAQRAANAKFMAAARQGVVDLLAELDAAERVQADMACEARERGARNALANAIDFLGGNGGEAFASTSTEGDMHNWLTGCVDRIVAFREAALRARVAELEAAQKAPAVTQIKVKKHSWHDENDHARRVASINAPVLSADWSERADALRALKPSPAKRAIGTNPTPEAREAHATRERAWARDYRQAQAGLKKARARELAEQAPQGEGTEPKSPT